MSDPITLLVTGANGFVGQALCTESVRRGLRVKGATRTARELPAGTQPAVIGSLDERTNWESSLQGVDVVIHLAARVHVMQESAEDPLGEFRRVNVAATEHLARAAAASGVRRLVYVSSIKVNGEKTDEGRSFTEADVPSPQDNYGASKWEAERVLHRVAKETGLEIVIMRPPLVYGPGVKGNFVQMLGVLSKNSILPLASVSNRRSLVYIGNFVDALLISATHPSAAGQTYLISDREDVSTPDLLRMLGNAMGHPARLLSCPPVMLKLAGRLLGRSEQIDRLLGSLQVDSSKICRELRWQQPFTMQQGLEATANWYRAI